MLSYIWFKEGWLDICFEYPPENLLSVALIIFCTIIMFTLGIFIILIDIITCPLQLVGYLLYKVKL